jgi:hypothetical protein
LCRCILQHEYDTQGRSDGGVDIWKLIAPKHEEKRRINMGLADVQFLEGLKKLSKI